MLDVPDVTFFNLQVPVPSGDQPWLRTRAKLAEPNPAPADFRVTASLVGQMDLMIVADTAVAHLVGALGKPTWTLVPYAADWRWLLGREDTPWYPTMRLFRQTRRGDWRDSVRRAATELKLLRRSRAGPRG